MWIPKSIVDWITTVKLEESQTLREENAALRAERDALKNNLTASQFQFDWIRGQINSLQLERAALYEQLYGVKITAPELARVPVPGKAGAVDEFSFDDIGEDLAKKFGLPTYDTRS
jgi:hypothetical protein